MSNNLTTNKPPIWFWVIAVIALLWNLAGLSAYFMQMGMGEADLAALPEAERTMYEAFPIWANIAFAVAVFAGTMGCIALLLRKRIALSLFIISLMGIIVQQVYIFAVSGIVQLKGMSAMVMPTMVVLFGVFLIWFGRYVIERGWVR